jgi:hypothetical protein
MVCNAREFINSEMKRLEGFNLIVIEWLEKNNLIKSVYLNLSSVNEAYGFIGQTALNDVIGERIKTFEEFAQKVRTDWIIHFTQDVLTKLLEKKMPTIAKDDTGLDFLLKTLLGIEEKGEEVLPERLFSKRFLGDSKVFERYVRSKLVTVYKTYAYRGDKEALDWEDEDFLQEIEIVKSVEEMQAWGNLQYESTGKVMNFANFPYGCSIQSEAILTGRVQHITQKQLLIIENKTVFREYVKKKKHEDE